MNNHQKAMMNPILALACAFAASNPPLMRDLERISPKPEKVVTDADRERLAKAQAKRERRANKNKTKRMLAAVRKAPPDARVTELDGKALFFSVDAEQDWIDNCYELTDAEEAEAQALSDHGGDAMALARKFAGVQS